jgi:tetratricopeptide (TPR) repeat protein
LQETALLPLLANIEHAVGRSEAALAVADSGLSQMAEVGLNGWRTYLMIERAAILAGADPARAEQGYRDAVELAAAQGARALGLRAALALAKLLTSTGRPMEAYDALAPALEGFSPTPLFPAIAEAQALLAELEQSDAVRADRRNRGIRAKYAQAVYITEGATTAATKAAFDRVDLSDFAKLSETEHVTALYGHFLQAVMSGRLREGPAIAAAGLRDGTAANRNMVVAVAHRLMSVAHYYLGAFAAARASAERALSMVDERWAAAHRVALGNDILCQAQSIAAQALGPLGEFEASARHGAEAARRAHETGEPFIIASVHVQDLVRLWAADQPAETLRVAEALGAVVSASGIGAWEWHARLFNAWASGRLADPVAAAEAVRESWVQWRQREAHFYDPIALVMLADLAASAGAGGEALRYTAEGLEVAAAQGAGFVIAPLHRLRGQAHAFSDAAQAETAFRESIRVAREQGARTFELQAALPLARLLQTNNHPLDAHEVLGEALKGFSPTPEFPSIAEAQALLSSLAADDAVATELRKRETRAKLHSGYALASMMTKGFAADETKAALARAEGASGVARSPEYWTVRYGRLVGDLMAAKFDALREGAIAFIAEAEAAGQPGHAPVARRVLGFAKIITGDFAGAAADLRRAVADYDDARDAELNANYGHDVLANALATLAQATWYLGDVDEAERLADAAIARAEASGRVVSQIQAIACRNFFAVQTDRPEILLENARKTLALAERHELAFWKTWASQSILWTRACLGEPCADAYREDFERRPDFGGRLMLGLRYGALAKVERAVGRAPEALAAIERALAIGAENGEGEFTTLRLRLRADIRAKLDPAAAEADFHAALDLARAQGSPTLALLVALDLAKFLRARSREREAHDALAPSLDGLAPTPLFPAIAEAHALLAELSDDPEVKAQTARRDQRLRLQVAYGNALVSARGYGSAETGAAFARARELAGEARDPLTRFSALYGAWFRALVTRSANDAFDAACDMIAETRGAEDTLLGGVARWGPR